MICTNKAIPSVFRRTFNAFAGVVICMAGVSPAAAAETSLANRSTDADGTLDAIFWSKLTPPTTAQAANRKALPLEVKEALLDVAQNKPLDANKTAALAKAGLTELNPANTTWTSKAETVAVPVGKSTAASAALNLAAAQCWITRAEVQRWGFATQSFGWKRQVDWCADGTRVTSRHRDFPSVGYVDFTYHYRGADPIQANDVGGWQVRTYQSATFEQCLTHLGCSNSFRPWIEFQLHGNNTASHTKGV
ncbi:hypothetical protein [Arthrobacter bambusae]|uniref:hypothetical protein n=1 Tax=Arthrobacter bambusae TaxID=1338426 RepID=UPI002789ADC5|nr:hypothetical protein [Arthrobacter bambusae]MDQ0029672.1 hypothetical protein [Arthrobacter bambusae]MDQ0097332.1 hypothetical protein [Arthrobacter bambusae]